MSCNHLTAGKMRHPGAKSLWSVLRCKDSGFVDLLEGCLRWDPAERMTPEEAMAHPWMAELREQQQQNSPYRWVLTSLLLCVWQLLRGSCIHKTALHPSSCSSHLSTWPGGSLEV